MSYDIVVTLRFEKEIKRLVKKYPSLKTEFAQLVTELQFNPLTGNPLGNNCFKVRLAIGSKGKGKRGGARVITYLYRDNKTLYLLTIYDKGEKPNIQDYELEDMIAGLDLS